MGRPLPRARRGRAGRSLLGTAVRRQPDAAGSDRRDRRLAASALHRGRDRGGSLDGALDGVRDPDPAGDGEARATRTRARSTLRALAAERARARRRQEARAHRGRRWQARPGGGRRHYTPTYTDREGKRRATVGWEYVHIAVDDHSRLAYAEVLADEKAATAVGFFRRALAFFGRHGIRVERLLTDNGSAYRSPIHALACRSLGIRHLRTRPYRPQTNGKAERFIRTLLSGWAYGAVYRSSAERTAALDGWLWHYNHRRRHSALGHQPPVARLNGTNLLGTYS